MPSRSPLAESSEHAEVIPIKFIHKITGEMNNVSNMASKLIVVSSNGLPDSCQEMQEAIWNSFKVSPNSNIYDHLKRRPSVGSEPNNQISEDEKEPIILPSPTSHGSGSQNEESPEPDNDVIDILN